MRWFGGRTRRKAPLLPEVAETPDPEIDGLTERLQQMRGDNPTAMPAGSGSTGSSTMYSGKPLAHAARDARFVDRSNEDDRLREVTEYRSIDD